MIIGLTGKKQHGKDTTGQYLVENHGFVRVAFADKVYEMAAAIDPLIASEIYLSEAVSAFGKEYVKQNFPEYRRFLQRLGTEGVRETLGDSTWIDAALTNLDPDCNYVITDVRFLNEAAAIRDRGGVIWRVTRPDLPDDGDTHASEVELEQIVAERVITNGSPFPRRLEAQVDIQILELLDRLPTSVVG